MITRISVGGIAVITAALIVLLSAFNGIEKMIEALYSEYDSDITVRPATWKTCSEHDLNIAAIQSLPEVVNVSRAVEEVVILTHEKKRVNANLVGVDSVFLAMTHMERHMVDGSALLRKEGEPVGIIGATLLDKLDGYIPENVGFETVFCYAPKRKIKLLPGVNPFRTLPVKLVGRMNFNREVNAQTLVVPLDYAREVLEYTHQISALYIEVRQGNSNEAVKAKIQKIVGDHFSVKTNFEKNQLIYQTSKSEKLIVLVILLFIFILAAFSLVASLTMLFVEKLDNIRTMEAFGVNRQSVFRIFFYEGLLISGKGIIIGALLGYAVCLAQLQFAWLTMPNSNGEPFPIRLSMVDGAVILSLVIGLSVLFSYFPVKYLIYRNLEK